MNIIAYVADLFLMLFDDPSQDLKGISVLLSIYVILFGAFCLSGCFVWLFLKVKNMRKRSQWFKVR